MAGFVCRTNPDGQSPGQYLTALLEDVGQKLFGSKARAKAEGWRLGQMRLQQGRCCLLFIIQLEYMSVSLSYRAADLVELDHLVQQHFAYIKLREEKDDVSETKRRFSLYQRGDEIKIRCASTAPHDQPGSFKKFDLVATYPKANEECLLYLSLTSLPDCPAFSFRDRRFL